MAEPVPSPIEVNGRLIGQGQPTYVIAEMSANHNHNYEHAEAIVRAACEAGADAVKLQTADPATLTLESDRLEFRIDAGTVWDGRTLHELYREACAPWEWQPKLKALADELGIACFSSPFSREAVDFLRDQVGVPAYKVASAEIVDLPLVRYIAQQGRPVLISTGMATLGEIEEAIRVTREEGAQHVALLKCCSAYPSPPEEMNLATIPHMAQTFGVPVGLSDHTLGSAVSIAAVALGACIIEKHLTLSRALGGPDASFSLEPDEFRALVRGIRSMEKAVGSVRYGPTASELLNRGFRRSLFAVRDIAEGELITDKNVRSIRPSNGLEPKYLPLILGARAAFEVPRGTPLRWDLLRWKKTP